MNTQIFSSYSKFLARKDKRINGVSKEFAKKHPDYVEDNESNGACWNCTGCKGCWDCYCCTGCINCLSSWNCNNCTDLGDEDD